MKTITVKNTESSDTCYHKNTRPTSGHDKEIYKQKTTRKQTHTHTYKNPRNNLIIVGWLFATISY